jgi:hypothetical protein
MLLTLLICNYKRRSGDRQTLVLTQETKHSWGLMFFKTYLVKRLSTAKRCVGIML